jgi:hypothetical protein
MDSKKIIEKLVRIAHSQQKIIHKLAQQALPPDSLPTSGTTFPPGQSVPPVVPPAPVPLKPAEPTKTEAKAIIDNLPAPIREHLVQLEVHNGQVKVRWKSPVSQNVFNVVTKTVQDLQNKNVLPGKSYQVTES